MLDPGKGRRETDRGEGAQAPRDQAQFGHSPLVFVPAHPVVQDRHEMAEYEMREMSNGVEVLPAFTTVEQLIEQLGKSQPWLRMSIQDVIDITGPDHVAINPVVDATAWRWTADDLSGFSNRYREHTEDVS